MVSMCGDTPGGGSEIFSADASKADAAKADLRQLAVKDSASGLC